MKIKQKFIFKREGARGIIQNNPCKKTFDSEKCFGRGDVASRRLWMEWLSLAWVSMNVALMLYNLSLTISEKGSLIKIYGRMMTLSGSIPLSRSNVLHLSRGFENAQPIRTRSVHFTTLLTLSWWQRLMAVVVFKGDTEGDTVSDSARFSCPGYKFTIEYFNPFKIPRCNNKIRVQYINNYKI